MNITVSANIDRPEGVSEDEVKRLLTEILLDAASDNYVEVNRLDVVVSDEPFEDSSYLDGLDEIDPPHDRAATAEQAKRKPSFLQRLAGVRG
jgi:hypothetical protein